MADLFPREPRRNRGYGWIAAEFELQVSAMILLLVMFATFGAVALMEGALKLAPRRAPKRGR